MTKMNPLSVALASVFMSSIPVHTVFAAETSMVLEEIIVSARKREESQQEVPTAVTAFTGEDLLKRGVTDFDNISQNNPNVKITTGAAGAAVSSTIAIRGNLQNDITPQIDASVGTYIDGMIVSRTFGTTASMIDIENVQTVKGPQGTLFGRNTTGGAILIKTVDPDLSSGVTGFVRAEAGEVGTRSYTGAVNLPVSETVAIRLAGNQSSNDAYVDYDNGEERGDRDSSTLRAKLLWEATDATSVLVSAEHVEVDATAISIIAEQPNNGDYSNLSSVGGVYLGGLLVNPALASDDEQSVTADTYNLAVTHDTGWGEVKFLTGVREAEVGIVMTLPPGLGYTRQDKPALDQYSAELQVNGSFFDDKLDLTSGIYYFDEHTEERQDTHTYESMQAFGFPETLSVVGMDTDVKSASIYGQGTYAFTDNTNLTLGMRFTDDHRESKGSVTDGAPLTFEDDASEFNYLVTLDHHFTDDFMAYVSTATGYRSSGANLSRNPDNPDEWKSFAPESVTNYEIGFKSDWLDGQLRLNGAAFYQDYSDYQYTQIVVDPDSGSPVRNALTTDVTIEGGELELTALLPADMQMTISYGYIKAETTDGIILPNIPQNTYSVGLSKLVTLDTAEIDLRANYDFRDDFYTQVGQEENSKVDSRGLLNLSATYQPNDDWSVMGYVNNVTDEHYYTHITYSPASPSGLFGLSFSSVGMPRVAGVRVTYNF